MEGRLEDNFLTEMDEIAFPSDSTIPLNMTKSFSDTIYESFTQQNLRVWMKLINSEVIIKKFTF